MKRPTKPAGRAPGEEKAGEKVGDKAKDPAALPFRRERLLAVGTLALVSPIPLSFSYSVEVPVLALYMGLLGCFLLAVRRGKILCLSNASLNLVGLVALPLFYLDIRYGGGTLLRKAVHLLLFTALLKLASVRRERDFSVTLFLVAFLFLGAVATSFHSTMLLFVAAYAFLAWPILSRWALWRDLAATPEEWTRHPEAKKLPGLRPTVVSVVLALAVAVPLFFALPRLKAPYVRGLTQGRDISTGFSENVDPDAYGELKLDDTVYLRVVVNGPVGDLGPDFLRLRALAFSRYESRRWLRPEGRLDALRADAENVSPLGRAERLLGARARMEIDLVPLQSRFVPYPNDAAGVRPIAIGGRPMPLRFERDGLRNLLLPFEPERAFQYEVSFRPTPEPDVEPPAADDPSRRPLRSERVRRWAEEIAGGLDPGSRAGEIARRMETYLQTKFTYSLNIPKPGANPVEDFLFVRRAGHCEAFASAMALALRELGIPTRFVTGFSGGELGLFRRYYLVRGRDAHAWVEAWTGPETGWRAFDPTPAVGRPLLTEATVARSLANVGDAVEFAFSRWVLGFGQGDQLELVRLARDAASAVGGMLSGLAARLRGAKAGGAVALGLALLVAAAYGIARLAARWSSPFGLLARWRALPPAADAYRKLQRFLRRRGAPLGPSSAPGDTLHAAARLGSAPLAAAKLVVGSYVRESYGGVPTADSERAALLEALRRVRAAGGGDAALSAPGGSPSGR